MSLIYISLTAPFVNEYFGVGVTSVAKDGAAPELNPGRVHRRINTNPEVRHAPHSPAKKKNKNHYLREPYRASAVLPSTSPSRTRFGRYAIHGYACHCTRTVLIDHRSGLLIF